MFRNQLQKMVKHTLRSRGSIREEEGEIFTQIKAFRQRVQSLMSAKTQLPEVDSLEYLWLLSINTHHFLFLGESPLLLFFATFNLTLWQIYFSGSWHGGMTDFTLSANLSIAGEISMTPISLSSRTYLIPMYNSVQNIPQVIRSCVYFGLV